MQEKYQLFENLRNEEFSALRADIAERGVQVPVEYDEDGNVLDGHHRVKIATELGIDFPSIVRSYDSETAKREHVIKLNLARRHMEPHDWGLAFEMLLSERGIKRGRGANQGQHSPTVGECAAELGVAESVAYHRLNLAGQFQSLPPDAQTVVRNRECTIRKAMREVRRRELRDPGPLPEGTFRVIYADPPWQYGDRRSDLGTTGAETHYPTMTLKEICEMPVQEIAAPNCVLFLWATSPLAKEAFQVLDAWGFHYRAMFVWDKQAHNFGHYQSVRHELLLLGTRGSMTPDSAKLEPSIMSIKRGRHSEKPQEFRELIERMYRGPRVELFAREAAPGWTAWGNQFRQAEAS